MAMTDEELEAIERRATSATAGPWRACGADRGGCQCGQVWSTADDVMLAKVVGENDDESRCSKETQFNNATFIASAITDVPNLVSEVRWWREELAIKKHHIGMLEAALLSNDVGCHIDDAEVRRSYFAEKSR